MKQRIIYLLTLIFLGSVWACDVDKPSNNTIFTEDDTVTTEFDSWLEENFIRQYNIQYVYRFIDSESDNNYYLVPPDYDKSRIFAKIVQHCLLAPYDEVTGDPTFLKKYFPKMIFLVGNEAYNNIGTSLLGVAEGGMRITLYGINDTDMTNATDLNTKFHTCHHEFAHILHQTVMYTEAYREISGVDYVGDSWTQVSSQEALNKGFISSYSSKEHSEDFVEIYSNYVTMSPDEWEATLNRASEEGRNKLEQKLGLVETYFAETWNIELKEMRSVILRRMSEINLIDYDNF